MTTSQIFNVTILRRAALDACFKFDPRQQVRNPVMLVVTLGALLTTGTVFKHLFMGESVQFEVHIALWLWFTSYFGNLAEAFAEGRGKAQADSLKKTRNDAQAKVIKDGQTVLISAAELHKGDTVICEANDIIPGDGEVIEGIASVDESAITGESAPVIRESGGDRSAVTGGTRVISDRILIRITAEPGESFLDQMIHLVEGAQRQKTPNEIALNILLITLTLVFLLAVITLKAFTHYSESMTNIYQSDVTLPVLIALLVCLIPTTIGGLLSAIGISGMDRLLQKNVLATSGRAVEAAGDIDVLLLDKTGTITYGNRMASGFICAPGIPEKQLAYAAALSSLADETPEGRSIVSLATEQYAIDIKKSDTYTFIPFQAETRMSGVDEKGTSIRKGAADSIFAHIEKQGGRISETLKKQVKEVANRGSTPLVVSQNQQILGIIELKDTVKVGIKERFMQLRSMGIRTIMITGDNPLTAAAIATEAGVDDFMAEATPEDKLKRIRSEQEKGHMVAMVGDGTNDAPALAQADVGVAMNSGTQAAREAGNMVDLDSNPTKLIEVVEIGKQLLMTRGALTTFSIANDVAKYFAILPALFGGIYATGTPTGPLSQLNVMGLASPQSAILSAVIFNALIIVCLIPLALQGIHYRPMKAESILKRNLLIYGVGGLIAPFIGIKAIDLALNALGIF